MLRPWCALSVVLWVIFLGLYKVLHTRIDRRKIYLVNAGRKLAEMTSNEVCYGYLRINRSALRPQYWRMTIPMITVQRMRNTKPKTTTIHCTKPKGGMASQTSLKFTSIPPTMRMNNKQQRRGRQSCFQSTQGAIGQIALSLPVWRSLCDQISASFELCFKVWEQSIK